jgi:hypothetical protein
MSNVQYYTIIEKKHQCNWSFGHQFQHSNHPWPCRIEKRWAKLIVFLKTIVFHGPINTLGVTPEE